MDIIIMRARGKIRDFIKNGEVSGAVAEELQKLLANKKEILPGWTPSYLRKLGDIQTIIDIGVLNGTPPLYDSFPNAALHLIEPLPQYKKKCRQIIRDRAAGGKIYNCAAGAKDGTATIRYYKDLPAHSSMFKKVGANTLKATEIEVEQKCLDSLFASQKMKRDILLKIDTEGMELEILKGATSFLKQVKYCLLEVSIRHRHQNSYRFADLVTFLSQNGFDLYDVITVTRSKAQTPKASIMDGIFINSAM